MTLSLKSEALAFRVWQVAEPLGWNLTYADAADLLGESRARVRTIAHMKGWTNRFRAPPSATDVSNRFHKWGVIGVEVYDQTMDLAEDGVRSND